MRITRVFLEQDMRMGVEGLRAIAEKESASLNRESTIIFINRKRTMFKLLRANKYLVVYPNSTKRIPLEALAELPEAFGGSAMELNDAIKKALAKKGIGALQKT